MRLSSRRGWLGQVLLVATKPDLAAMLDEALEETLAGLVAQTSSPQDLKCAPARPPRRPRRATTGRTTRTMDTPPPSSVVGAAA